MHQPHEQRFHEALEHHRAGRHADAERIYREILAVDPNHAQATHFLGVLAHQFGHSTEAERLIRRSIELLPNAFTFHNNLGDVLRAQQRFNDAAASFMRSAELEPSNYLPPLNVGMTLAQLQLAPEAIPWLRKTLALKPDQPAAMFMLAQALLMTPDGKDEALRLLDQTIELEPANERALFVRAAVRGETPPAVPPGFVRGIFDGYAENFDQHLVERLKYCAPSLLRGAVLRALGDSPPPMDILDLGCGTGLVGEAFKDLARSLIGVDLSPGMLNKAKAKNVYDDLQVGDCIDALRTRVAALDLIVAGDVLIYLGDLTDIFEASARALRSLGLLAFTVEDYAGEGFVLNATRRFEHSRGYIAELAARWNFDVVSSDEVSLRREAQQDVKSRLYVMRKP